MRFSFPFNLHKLSDENLFMIVFFFLENFTPTTADLFNILKVEFKLCIVIISLEMLKLGYKTGILITQYRATILFGVFCWFLFRDGFLSKSAVTKNLCKSTTGLIDYWYFYLAYLALVIEVDPYFNQKLL